MRRARTKARLSQWVCKVQQRMQWDSTHQAETRLVQRDLLGTQGAPGLKAGRQVLVDIVSLCQALVLLLCRVAPACRTCSQPPSLPLPASRTSIWDQILAVNRQALQLVYAPARVCPCSKQSSRSSPEGVQRGRQDTTGPHSHHVALQHGQPRIVLEGCQRALQAPLPVQPVGLRNLLIELPSAGWLCWCTA